MEYSLSDLRCQAFPQTGIDKPFLFCYSHFNMTEIEKVAAQRRKKIQALIRKETSLAQIAKQMGVSRQRVWQIVNSKHWRMFL